MRICVGTLIVGTIANNYRDLWRLGMLTALPLAAFLFFVMRDKSTEIHVPVKMDHKPERCLENFGFAWVGYCRMYRLSEFAISFWAAALIIDRTGATPAISTLTVAALGTGMAVGRWYGGRILKHWHLDTQLSIFIGVQAVGFTIVWFSHNLQLSFLGVLIAGLGISNQFALASLRMIGLSRESTRPCHRAQLNGSRYRNWWLTILARCLRRCSLVSLVVT
jgi:hypothetical protein